MDKNEQDTILAELAELRAEVERLREEREAATAAEDVVGSARKAVHEAASDISAELQDIVDAAEKELKDTNPVTLLAIFALGAFVGRLLPK